MDKLNLNSLSVFMPSFLRMITNAGVASIIGTMNLVSGVSPIHFNAIIIFITFIKNILMRYLLPLFAVLAFCYLPSCTKTKYVDRPVHDTTVVNVPVHDTTIFHTLLFGNWQPVTGGSLLLSFTKDSIIWSSGYGYEYAANKDTIYHIFNRSLFIPVLTYSFCVSGDTLFTTTAEPIYVSTTYVRY